MLKLKKMRDQLAVCRLEAGAKIPPWAVTGSFFSVTRTEEELSITCSQTSLPGQDRADHPQKVEKGWRAFKVEGPLDFSLTGILASLAGPLGLAGISIFALSTFDTDYILVKKEDFNRAETVLGNSAP